MEAEKSRKVEKPLRAPSYLRVGLKQLKCKVDPLQSSFLFSSHACRFLN